MNGILIVLDDDGMIGAIYANSAHTRVAVRDYANHRECEGWKRRLSACRIRDCLL
jgi:hypothetical protein